MSYQPISGDNWTSIGTVGTAVVTAREAVLCRIIVPGTYVGSVAFYDVATIAGTTATNRIFTAGLPASAIPTTIDIFAQCRNGLVYASTGTPTITFTWN